MRPTHISGAMKIKFGPSAFRFVASCDEEDRHVSRRCSVEQFNDRANRRRAREAVPSERTAGPLWQVVARAPGDIAKIVRLDLVPVGEGRLVDIEDESGSS